MKWVMRAAHPMIPFNVCNHIGGRCGVRLGALYCKGARAGAGLRSDFITVLIFALDGEERETGDNRTAVVW